MDVSPGTYEHYKGKQYEVIGVGKLEATLEDVVIYRSLYNSEEFGDHALWVRSLINFTEMVEIKGKSIPRFRKLK